MYGGADLGPTPGPRRAIFNNTPHFSADFPLCGHGYLPNLVMDNSGMVYFKPTWCARLLSAPVLSAAGAAASN